MRLLRTTPVQQVARSHRCSGKTLQATLYAHSVLSPPLVVTVEIASIRVSIFSVVPDIMTVVAEVTAIASQIVLIAANVTAVAPRVAIIAVAIVAPQVTAVSM